jgi:hypothetical protein
LKSQLSFPKTYPPKRKEKEFASAQPIILSNTSPSKAKATKKHQKNGNNKAWRIKLPQLMKDIITFLKKK